MLPPKVEGRLLQALGIGSEERVLEIGAGSGFLTWLLAQRAAHVTGVELKPALAERARANLAAHRVGTPRWKSATAAAVGTGVRRTTQSWSAARCRCGSRRSRSSLRSAADSSS